MIQWLDHPFVNLLTQINTLFPYFKAQAKYLAGFLLMLNISLSAIKYGITHQGLKDDVVKTCTAFVLFTIIIGTYPNIITGLNTIAYKWAMNSTYTKTLAQTIDKTRNNSEFWAKKGDKAEDAYSDIIKKVAVVEGGGQVGYKYVLDLYLPGTGYISPASLMRVVILILDNILFKANNLARNRFGIVHDMSSYIMLLLTAFCVLLAGILGFGQYFVAAIEFQIIASVGIITLPGMLWNSTKFLTEKLVGAIFGFFIKMLFVSIAIMLMFNGLLIMMTMEFSGAIDQLVYTVFTCFLYVSFCQSAPALAISLLTGTPQMSLMELGAAAAAIAGGAYGAKKVVGAGLSAGAKGTTSLGGGMLKTIGSSVQGAKNAARTSSESGAGTFRTTMAAIGGGTLAGAASAGHSMLKTAGAGLNSMGKKLLGRKTENKHSSLERFQQGSPTGGPMASPVSPELQNTDVGNARSVADYFKAKFNEGKQFSKDMFTKPIGKPGTEPPAGFKGGNWPVPLNPNTLRIAGDQFSNRALPSPENIQAPVFAESPDKHLIAKHGLSYPSSTPSRLALPPPKKLQ